ncbi:hypothetical protein VTK73DRAFT_6812 [Phialemonium thermophilum]|uniref:ATPase, vacuolar ER assembly factor, Vma12 n=1 Tax=Phialemonium thermophilum TaxID=223376 RepID=A0ABR3Y8M9_9PEZI
MVLLTMTPSIVEGLRIRREGSVAPDGGAQAETIGTDEHQSLEDPAVGNPISHRQILDLWKHIRSSTVDGFSLEELLRGTSIYKPPPPPRPEPSDEYKALMARLRREEEERVYERMTRQVPGTETFLERFPSSAHMARVFAEVHRPIKAADVGDDGEVINAAAYRDVQKQLMLVLNLLLSIFGVAGALWVLARWWSTPARLFLAMGGSIMVGIVEVSLYCGYLWHVGQARKKESKVREVKDVLQTWMVGTDGAEDPAVAKVKDLSDERSREPGKLRRRKQKGPG